MADREPLIEFEDKDYHQSEISSIRYYRPVEIEADNYRQSAGVDLANILGDTWTEGPSVKRSQGWDQDPRDSTGPGPGSHGQYQPGRPVTSIEPGPLAGERDRYVTLPENVLKYVASTEMSSSARTITQKVFED